MADLTKVEIEQDQIGWVLRVINPGMKAQEYRCASREQAQALADVMTGNKAASGMPKGKAPPPKPAAPAPPAAKPPVKK